MEIIREITYQEFLPMLENCFPEEDIDEIVFLNNVQNHQFLFAVHQDQACGYLLFDLKTKPARIIQLCVLNSFRNLGIGSELLEHLKKLLSDQNITDLILNVDSKNIDAIRFYEKHGFVSDKTDSEYQFDTKNVGTLHHHLTISEMIDNLIIQDQFSLGETLTKYLLASPSNTFYEILNESGNRIGSFLYSSKQSEISLLKLDNSYDMQDAIYLIARSFADQPTIWFSSNQKMINQRIENVPGILIQYKLKVMKFHSTLI